MAALIINIHKKMDSEHAVRARPILYQNNRKSYRTPTRRRQPGLKLLPNLESVVNEFVLLNKSSTIMLLFYRYVLFVVDCYCMMSSMSKNKSKNNWRPMGDIY